MTSIVTKMEGSKNINTFNIAMVPYHLAKIVWLFRSVVTIQLGVDKRKEAGSKVYW